MAYSREMIEYLHDSGAMNDFVYYSLCDWKSPQQKYNEQRKKFLDSAAARRRPETQIDIDEKALKETIENAANDILKDLKID